MSNVERILTFMDEQPIPKAEPNPQASKPAIKLVTVLGCNSHDAAQLHDLSGAHTTPGYVLDYRILSLMPSNDVAALFHLT